MEIDRGKRRKGEWRWRWLERKRGTQTERNSEMDDKSREKNKGLERFLIINAVLARKLQSNSILFV